MTIFWQHVGAANSARDFPRTIGTPRTGLCEFSIDDVHDGLSDLGPLQQAELSRNFDRIGKTRFQVWGLPAGAKDVLRNMIVGDGLLLLDTNGEGGAFRYLGRVLYRLPSEHWDPSNRLWNESTYPIIVLLRGELIAYPWTRFLADFGWSWFEANGSDVSCFTECNRELALWKRGGLLRDCSEGLPSLGEIKGQPTH